MIEQQTARAECELSGCVACGDAPRTVRYMLTVSSMLLGAYTYTDGRANELPGASASTLKLRWNQLALNAVYALSKRTELYLRAHINSLPATRARS